MGGTSRGQYCVHVLLAVLLQLAASTNSQHVFEYLKHFELEKVWDDTGSGATLEGSFWRPVNVPPGYHYVGHYGKAGHAITVGDDFVQLLRDLQPESANLRLPRSLVWVYDDYKTGARDLTVVAPVPHDGYACIGYLAYPMRRMPQVSDFPGYACVRKEHVVSVAAGEQIWNDRKSGGRHDFSAWRVAETQNDGLFTGAFVGHRSYSVYSDSLYAVKSQVSRAPNYNLTNEQVLSAIRDWAPDVHLDSSDTYFPDDPEFVFLRSEFVVGQLKNLNSAANFKIDRATSVPVARLAATKMELNTENIKRYPGIIGESESAESYSVWLTIPQHLQGGNLLRAISLVKVSHNEMYTDLVFFLFYPYNGPGMFNAKCGAVNFIKNRRNSAAGRHEGDWEAMALRLQKAAQVSPHPYGNSRPALVYLSRHNGGEWVPFSSLLFDDSGRRRVYSAKHSHAMYARPGRHEYCRPKSVNAGICTFAVDLIDECSDGPKYSVSRQFDVYFPPPPSVADPGRRYLQFDGRWGRYERVHEAIKFLGITAYTWDEVGNGPSGPKQKSFWSSTSNLRTESTTC